MHWLEAFAFDSILVPYNFIMMQQPHYAHDFEALYTMCQARGVAVQTIKGIAAVVGRTVMRKRLAGTGRLPTPKR